MLKETVTYEGYQSVCSETMTHLLFGGSTSRKQNHSLCQMKVHSLIGNFVGEIPLLHQNVICGKILRLKREPWERGLKELNIWISDYGKGYSNKEVLIGAEILGYCLFNRCTSLNVD